MQTQGIGSGLDVHGGIERTKALLVCGAVACPLFTIMFLIEGATRAGYNPLRHPVSSLALGDFGWLQVANFIVSGLLTLAFAIGLRGVLQPLRGSIWGPLLVGIWAIGLLGAGVFATDPVSGYPPGTADLVRPTTSGRLHDLFSLLGFIGLVAACFVFSGHFARRGRIAWAVYSAASGVVFVAALVLASAGFSQAESLVAIGGLIQRFQVATAWAWQTLLALHFLKVRPEAIERSGTYSASTRKR
jgi:hypothetical protein